MDVNIVGANVAVDMVVLVVPAVHVAIMVAVSGTSEVVALVKIVSGDTNDVTICSVGGAVIVVLPVAVLPVAVVMKTVVHAL